VSDIALREAALRRRVTPTAHEVKG
jgi:hypothetical protein